MNQPSRFFIEATVQSMLFLGQQLNINDIRTPDYE